MFWHNVEAELFEQGNIETIPPKTVKGHRVEKHQKHQKCQSKVGARWNRKMSEMSEMSEQGQGKVGWENVRNIGERWE